MTDFQKKTLKNSCKILLTALAIAAGLIAITLFVCWQPYIAIGITVATIVVYGLIIPTVKDWKLRGKLTENEYDIYTYYRERRRYLGKERIVAELAHWNDGLTVEQLQEIIAKVEGSPTEN